MTAQEYLKAALNYFNIEIISINENHFTVGRGYEIEIEANGIYKLLSDGQVVAPFDDIEEMCRFILM
jgi:hypothetical protein